MKRYLLLLIIPILTLCCTTSEQYTSLRVLQFNVWNNGAMIENGDDEIIGIIKQTDPDIIFFNEIRDQILIDHIKDSLEVEGVKYYGDHLGVSTVILSKYPLSEVRQSYDGSDSEFKTELGVIAKAIINVEGQRFAIYSLHLDWLNAGSFLPRGYDGNTWAKMETPATDADSVLAFNLQSQRDEEIGVLLKDMAKEVESGSFILFGGDLNEPSHQDWQTDTKDIRDHNGLIVNWDCSIMLQKSGYNDSYRELYPNALTHPGFTCPAGNKGVGQRSLQWSEGKDSRDRIDFIYYHPNEKLKLVDAAIVGPKEDFYDGIHLEQTEDKIITPNSGAWCSDHKATYAEFKLFIEK